MTPRTPSPDPHGLRSALTQPLPQSSLQRVQGSGQPCLQPPQSTVLPSDPRGW